MHTRRFVSEALCQSALSITSNRRSSLEIRLEACEQERTRGRGLEDRGMDGR